MEQATPSKRLHNDQAAEYLRQHGVRMSAKTLRNRRAAGTGPRCRYLGSTPVYEPADLDAWVEAELHDAPANRRAA